MFCNLILKIASGEYHLFSIYQKIESLLCQCWSVGIVSLSVLSCAHPALNQDCREEYIWYPLFPTWNYFSITCSRGESVNSLCIHPPWNIYIYLYAYILSIPTLHGSYSGTRCEAIIGLGLLQQHPKEGVVCALRCHDESLLVGPHVHRKSPAHSIGVTSIVIALLAHASSGRGGWERKKIGQQQRRRRRGLPRTCDGLTMFPCFNYEALLGVFHPKGVLLRWS